MIDGLWAVIQPTWVAGFVVSGGEVTMCAPILRAKITYWKSVAHWVCP